MSSPEELQSFYDEKSQAEAVASVEKSKQATEFARYKQDCRKRALDLAHDEYAAWWLDKTANIGATDRPQPNVEEIANGYYRWLTEF